LRPAYIIQLIPYSTHFYPEDTGSIFLWNIGIHLQDNMLSQVVRSRSEQSWLWKHKKIYYISK
jgi:hypothetical protein